MLGAVPSGFLLVAGGTFSLCSGGIEAWESPGGPQEEAGTSAQLLKSGPFPLSLSTLPGQIRNPPLLSVPAAASGDNGNWVTIPTAETTNWCGHQGGLSCKGQTSIREQPGADTGLGKGFDLFLSCRGMEYYWFCLSTCL